MNAPETIPTDDRLAITVRGLEPASAIALREAFAPLLAKAQEWTASAQAIRVTSADDKAGMKLARDSRLALRSKRIEVEKTRVRLKADALAYGKAVDAIANQIKSLIEPIEAHLLEQETFAERAAEAERKRVAAAREEALRALGTDPAAYADLGAMTEEVWSAALTAAKAAQAAREEAARQAEAARIEAERLAAERAEAERVAREKAEAERAERERLQAEENARLRAERDRVEAEHAAERRRIEAEAKAEREAAEKARREAEQLRAQAERERRGREAAEQKRLADEAAERARLANAGDHEKLVALARALRVVDLPECSGDVGRDVVARVARMVDWVEARAKAVAS